MDDDIECYVKTYLMCWQNKTLRQRDTSLLQLLLILNKHWVSVSVDFIVKFLKVNSMDTVMVIINIFIKVHSVVATLMICITKVTIGLFYRSVVKYFGLPSDIMSDHDM